MRCCSCCCGPFPRPSAAELKVGDKASDFNLKDSTGKEYSLDHPQFKGKVLYIAYVDPDEKDMNNHVEDALKKEREAGGLDKTRYEGFGIANLKATNLPNFIIKSIIKSKQEKTGAIITARLRLHHPQPLGPQERHLRRGGARQGADLPVCLQRQAAAGRACQDDPDHQGVPGEVTLEERRQNSGGNPQIRFGGRSGRVRRRADRTDCHRPPVRGSCLCQPLGGFLRKDRFPSGSHRPLSEVSDTGQVLPGSSDERSLPRVPSTSSTPMTGSSGPTSIPCTASLTAGGSEEVREKRMSLFDRAIARVEDRLVSEGGCRRFPGRIRADPEDLSR
ncbi:MAG: hypothetical protein MZV70_48870 [Desulfobacterales bacterium]|nr:hypothetical protein [Desulfobacterales bacterium]